MLLGIFVLGLCLFGQFAATACLFFWVAEAYYDLREDHVAAAKAAQRMGKAGLVIGYTIGALCLTLVGIQRFAPEMLRGALSTQQMLIGVGAALAAGIVLPMIARGREREHLRKAGSSDADVG